jgi:diamine N-acetyltransferase
LSVVTLRRAVLADAGKLSLVGGASFLESFAYDHPGDDMVDHITERHSVETYRAWLSNPAYALWIVEEAVGAPIGYVVLGPPSLPRSTDGDIEIKRIYMLYRWHGGGHGKALFDAAVNEARTRGATRLILAVYSQNVLAQTFYARQGFTRIGETQFSVGSALFTDHVMALPL